MALGEHWKAWRAYDHLLFVKVATGIGCGIITDGRIHRGAQGAAGDIGHIHVPGNEEICRCGNRGCLEAVAGGGAMAARLRADGIDARNSRDVVRHVRDGRPAAMQLVRQAGRELGEVLAASVNFFNPGVIVIGGDIAHADEHLLAGVREVVYQRAVPLGTRSLRIVRSALDDRAGVIGAAVMVIEHVLAPDVVDRMLAQANAAALPPRLPAPHARAPRGRARAAADRPGPRPRDRRRRRPRHLRLPSPRAGRDRRRRSSASGWRRATGAASSSGSRRPGRCSACTWGWRGGSSSTCRPPRATGTASRSSSPTAAGSRCATNAGSVARCSSRTSPTSAPTPPRSAAGRSASGSAAARSRSRRGCSTRARSPASATCSRTRRCGARGSPRAARPAS